MIKKLLPILFLVIIIFSGCAAKKDEAELIAALPPEISNTDGKFLETNPPSMQGLVTDISRKNITLKVMGEYYKMSLSEKATEEIKIFAEKHNTIIERGSFIMVEYEETDGKYIANRISIMKQN